jgi:hypothetical protein
VASVPSLTINPAPRVKVNTMMRPNSTSLRVSVGSRYRLTNDCPEGVPYVDRLDALLAIIKVS